MLVLKLEVELKFLKRGWSSGSDTARIHNFSLKIKFKIEIFFYLVVEVSKYLNQKTWPQTRKRAYAHD